MLNAGLFLIAEVVSGNVQLRQGPHVMGILTELSDAAEIISSALCMRSRGCSAPPVPAAIVNAKPAMRKAVKRQNLVARCVDSVALALTSVVQGLRYASVSTDR